MIPDSARRNRPRWSLRAVLVLICSLAACSQNHPTLLEPAEEAAPVLRPMSTSPSSMEAISKGLAPITPPAHPLKDIYFEFDTYDLSRASREILRSNAEWMDANPSALVEIEGHADDLGTNDYNLALGAKRAQGTKEYLVSLGVPAERLNLISYGEEAPVCRDPAEECRRENRRVRFVTYVRLPPS
jgi:peptidoglycan-associated lipoprotein